MSLMTSRHRDLPSREERGQVNDADEDTQSVSRAAQRSRASTTRAVDIFQDAMDVQPEWVEALHAYTPSDAMLARPQDTSDGEPSAQKACLAFNPGDLIRVIHKDPSGWWDGCIKQERALVRGWFPSNYVREIQIESLRDGAGQAAAADDTVVASSSADTLVISSSHAAPTLEERRPSLRLAQSYDHSRVNSVREGRPVLTSAHSSPARSNAPSPASQVLDAKRATGAAMIGSAALSRARTTDAPEFTDMLRATRHAIGLLRKAVSARDLSHYQPSTACLISAIRAVLCATGCLDRDSEQLACFPQLAIQRKLVLSALARLVNQARKASTLDENVAPGSEAPIGPTALVMIDMAEGVMAQIEQFLASLFECGYDPVKPPDSPRMREPSSDTVTGPVQEPRGELARPTSRLLPRASFLSGARKSSNPKKPELHKVRSLGDLRNRRRSAKDSAPVPMPGSPRLEDSMPIRPLLQRGSTAMRSFMQAAEQQPTVSADAQSGWHAPLRLHTAAEIKSIMSQLHAQLLRTVAAFVSQAQVHTSTSHATSFLYLLDLAEEVIGTVREILDIIDVMRSSDSDRAIEDAHLLDISSNAVSRASIDLAQATEISLKRNATASDHRHLLHCATLVLQTAAESSSAVTIYLSHRLAEDGYALSEPASSSIVRRNGSPDELAFALARLANQRQDLQTSEPEDFARARSSYERIELLAAAQHSAKPDTHTSAGGRPQLMTDRSSIYGVQYQGGESMHRELSSRTSASTASSWRSGASDADTNNTSPRSSCGTPIELREFHDIARVQDGSRLPAGARLPASAKRAEELAFMRNEDKSATAHVDGGSIRRDYEPREICFNADGHITGGTLRCLVERLTLSDTTIDPIFASTFLMTFRLFASPASFVQALIERYDSQIRSQVQPTNRATPVSLRIYNCLKSWLETYWQQDTDAVVLDQLDVFAREALTATLPTPAQRLLDLIARRRYSVGGLAQRSLKRMTSIDCIKSSFQPNANDQAQYSPPAQLLAPPTPLLNKGAMQTLRSGSFDRIGVLDFDPLELARQLTLMESRLFCAITTRELLGQEFSKKQGTAINVKAMSSLSTRLTGWVAETIVAEQDAKKRAVLLKYFIKLADRCNCLRNYNCLMAIMAALDSSTISRLKKTWEGLSAKYKQLVECLRKSVEHTRNYSDYRAMIRNAVPPALPFLGLYLTDLTFCQDGNAATRPSPQDKTLQLINFDRYQKIAKTVRDLQRFQVPYNLSEIPEIQAYLDHVLRSLPTESNDLYRRNNTCDQGANEARYRCQRACRNVHASRFVML
ncbi:hypothetical protein E5Q_02474 [Mixia osmundae IAM 14324]|uniref:Ras GEF n=1 Tax=Mixia osmundae (strain CBS 9802 / IAM 14324 / JCM 22182 / KY 12970) TaxID=764103 RepID=G7DZ07_MIXOS|nr:hypothetical protein E5Q_02474 [Mixia osmundae IAM 14324]